MTDTSKREELIEAAADAIRWASEHGGWADMARAAFAVFEQAHTPSFAEALESLPTPAGCSGIGLPTDDEREVRRAAEERYPTTRPYDHEPTYPRSALRHYMQGAFISGWNASRAARRTAVQEPSEDGHDGWCGCEKCDPEPQVEPTDAQVLAALNARELSVRERSGSARHFNPALDLSYFSDGNVQDMRAALRAAYEEGKKR